MSDEEDQQNVPLEVTINTPSESEVTVGGDTFRVTVRSSAGLGAVVQAAQALYAENRPQRTDSLAMGFAGAHIERRETPVPPASSAPYPAVLETKGS